MTITISMHSTTQNHNSFSEKETLAWLEPEEVCQIKPYFDQNDDLPKIILHISRILFQFLLRILRTAFTLDHAYVKMRGYEKFSNNPVSITYFGDKISFHYITDLLFSKPPKIVEETSFRWWQLNRIFDENRNDCDLYIIDVSFPLTLWAKFPGFIVVPRWIMQRVDIANTWKEVMGRLRRKTRREAQRVIRKYNYRAHVIDGTVAADDFYERLYKPHIKKRHGLAAVVVPRKQFINSCSRGKIIQLVHDEKVISAALLIHTGRQLSIEWTGIAPDVDQTQEQGVTDALDYYTLLYAYQQGCDLLDMGPSRARVDDGLLRYKSKWGAVVYRKKIPQGRIIIGPVYSSDVALSAILNHKFISLENGELVSRVLLRGDMDQDSIEQVITNEWVEGLNRLSVFLQSDSLSGSARIHPQIKIVTHKSLCQLYNLFKNSFGTYKIQDL